MHWRRVHDGGDGDDAVEVVVLEEDDHDLQRSLNHGHSLFDVVRFDDQFFQIQSELKWHHVYVLVLTAIQML